MIKHILPVCIYWSITLIYKYFFTQCF